MEERTTMSSAASGTSRSGEPGPMRQSTWALLRMIYRRHRRIAGIAMASLVLVIAGGVFSAMQYFRVEKEAREQAEALRRAESGGATLRHALAAADTAA